MNNDREVLGRIVSELQGIQQYLAEPRPKVVCLCGSTRFMDVFQEASRKETLAGSIILSVGAIALSVDIYVKQRLDVLHLRKIDLADEILVLDVDGYVGESTANEIAYAKKLGKRIRYWSKEC